MLAAVRESLSSTESCLCLDILPLTPDQMLLNSVVWRGVSLIGSSNDVFLMVFITFLFSLQLSASISL